MVEGGLCERRRIRDSMAAIGMVIKGSERRREVYVDKISKGNSVESWWVCGLEVGVSKVSATDPAG